jgi:hypothetical protein
MSADLNASASPFLPAQTATVSLSVTNATSRVALTQPPDGGGNSYNAAAYLQYQVYNSGTNPVFVNFGGAAVVATAPNGATPGDYPVAPGATVVITVKGGAGITNVAAIGTVAGPAVIYVTPGNGN